MDELRSMTEMAESHTRYVNEHAVAVSIYIIMGVGGR